MLIIKGFLSELNSISKDNIDIITISNSIMNNKTSQFLTFSKSLFSSITLG